MVPDMHDATAISERLASRLKARHLTLLLNISALGSLTLVGQKMHMSQPAITQALTELEAIFGMPLFSRGARGVVATPAGEVALKHASCMIRDMEGWGSEMAAVDAGYAAHLKVGVIPFTSEHLICEVLRETMLDEQKFSVSIHEATTDQLLSRLVSHDLDCVIGRACVSSHVSQLRHEILYHQRPCLVAGSALGKRLENLPLDWQKLRDLAWLMPPKDTPVRQILTTLFVQQGLQPPQPLLESYSPKILAAILTAHPTAVAIVPDEIASELTHIASVMIVPYALQWDLPPIAIIRRNRPVASSAEEAFINVLRRQTKKMAGQQLTKPEGYAV
ncbi:LysR substrate-binding domain-containing protein [Burkholderia vietnamiensis]|uniref:LysR substrate-binding domain-containing protein n=1 Tax=Burkholderia vietnamiensis TaxID=60552 RepID=UPI001D14F41D|nr:LysR substrate-binding domain-containing protein [Burkholderia vietnamiensis]UEC01693.1 LysR family transcriptional regulator [Burkholderia vietnamiensis]